MKRRTIRILILVSMGIVSTLFLYVHGCLMVPINPPLCQKICSKIDCSLENCFRTSEDGFKYYIDEKIGLCIVGFPDTEVVRIPKYINGYEVMQLGYEEIGFMYAKIHRVDCSNVKHIIMEKRLITTYVSNIENIETLAYVGFYDNYRGVLRIEIEPGKYVYENNADMIKRGFYPTIQGETLIELRNADIELEPIIYEETFTLEIPEYVTVIEEGFFDRYENMIIRTSYQEKPDGWEEGWNGSCEVEWGVELKHIKMIEDLHNKNNNK